MVHYHFVDTKTNEIVKLDTVEEEFLAAIGEEAEYAKYLGDRAYQFELLCLYGINCTWDGKFDMDRFDAIKKDMPEHFIEPALNLLNIKYKFESWRW